MEDDSHYHGVIGVEDILLQSTDDSFSNDDTGSSNISYISNSSSDQETSFFNELADYNMGDIIGTSPTSLFTLDVVSLDTVDTLTNEYRLKFGEKNLLTEESKQILIDIINENEGALIMIEKENNNAIYFTQLRSMFPYTTGQEELSDNAKNAIVEISDGKKQGASESYIEATAVEPLLDDNTVPFIEKARVQIAFKYVMLRTLTQSDEIREKRKTRQQTERTKLPKTSQIEDIFGVESIDQPVLIAPYQYQQEDLQPITLSDINTLMEEQDRIVQEKRIEQESLVQSETRFDYEGEQYQEHKIVRIAEEYGEKLNQTTIDKLSREEEARIENQRELINSQIRQHEQIILSLSQREREILQMHNNPLTGHVVTLTSNYPFTHGPPLSDRALMWATKVLDLAAVSSPKGKFDDLLRDVHEDKNLSIEEKARLRILTSIIRHRRIKLTRTNKSVNSDNLKLLLTNELPNDIMKKRVYSTYDGTDTISEELTSDYTRRINGESRGIEFMTFSGRIPDSITGIGPSILLAESRLELTYLKSQREVLSKEIEKLKQSLSLLDTQRIAIDAVIVPIKYPVQRFLSEEKSRYKSLINSITFRTGISLNHNITPIVNSLKSRGHEANVNGLQVQHAPVKNSQYKILLQLDSYFTRSRIARTYTMAMITLLSSTMRIDAAAEPIQLIIKSAKELLGEPNFHEHQRLLQILHKDIQTLWIIYMKNMTPANIRSMPDMVSTWNKSLNQSDFTLNTKNLEKMSSGISSGILSLKQANITDLVNVIDILVSDSYEKLLASSLNNSIVILDRHLTKNVLRNNAMKRLLQNVLVRLSMISIVDLCRDKAKILTIYPDGYSSEGKLNFFVTLYNQEIDKQGDIFLTRNSKIEELRSRGIITNESTGVSNENTVFSVADSELLYEVISTLFLDFHDMTQLMEISPLYVTIQVDLLTENLLPKDNIVDLVLTLYQHKLKFQEGVAEKCVLQPDPNQNTVYYGLTIDFQKLWITMFNEERICASIVEEYVPSNADMDLLDLSESNVKRKLRKNYIPNDFYVAHAGWFANYSGKYNKYITADTNQDAVISIFSIHLPHVVNGTAPVSSILHSLQSALPANSPPFVPLKNFSRFLNNNN